MEHTVLLIGSSHLAWTGIRAALCAQRNLHIVEEIRCAERAVAAARSCSPALILLAADPCDSPTVEIAERLSACCRQTKLVLIGELLEPAEHAALAKLHFAGYVLWKDLRSGTLPRLVGIFLEDHLEVASGPIVQHLLHLAYPELAAAAAALCTDQDLAVLRGLARELTQAQIAQREGVSERTIRRRVEQLEERFDVRSLFALGARAHRLGLIES